MDWTQLKPLLVPLVTSFVVPAVMRGVKALLPSLPSWLIPILAPVVGAAGAGLSVATGAVAVTAPVALLGGMIGGSAGVGVREVHKQLTK